MVSSAAFGVFLISFINFNILYPFCIQINFINISLPIIPINEYFVHNKTHLYFVNRNITNIYSIVGSARRSPSTTRLNNVQLAHPTPLKCGNIDKSVIGKVRSNKEHSMALKTAPCIMTYRNITNGETYNQCTQFY